MHDCMETDKMSSDHGFSLFSSSARWRRLSRRQLEAPLFFLNQTYPSSGALEPPEPADQRTSGTTLQIFRLGF